MATPNIHTQMTSFKVDDGLSDVFKSNCYLQGFIRRNITKTAPSKRKEQLNLRQQSQFPTSKKLVREYVVTLAIEYV